MYEVSNITAKGRTDNPAMRETCVTRLGAEPSLELVFWVINDPLVGSSANAS
jgi:hypothetical protein